MNGPPGAGGSTLARQLEEATGWPLHDDAARLATDLDRWAAEGEPPAIGPVLRVDTSSAVDVGERVARLREAPAV